MSSNSCPPSESSTSCLTQPLLRTDGKAWPFRPGVYSGPAEAEYDSDPARFLRMMFFTGRASSCRALQVILPPASEVSNEGPSSRVLVPLPAVSWPWVSAWGSLEPPRRDGENAQKTGENGEKMGEIRPKKCEGRELTKDQLAGATLPGAGAGG